MYEILVPHKKTPTPYTIYKGVGENGKQKTWKTPKGGAKSSAYCNSRGNQPHGPNNSNHNAQNSKKIEDEPLPWYPANAFFDPYTGAIL